MKITKRVVFSAAHSIKGAGKCERKHGHNWEATIEVKLMGGKLDDKGFICDVRDLKHSAFQYDHRDLDDFFETPSTENVAQKIAEDALKVCINSNPDPDALFKIKVTLIETENNSAEAKVSNLCIH